MIRAVVSPNVLFAGGGTGGHLFPGIAVAEELLLRAPASRVVLAVTEREAAAAHARALPFETVCVGSPRRPAGVSGVPTFGVRMTRAVLRTRRLLAKERIDVVVGLGGYGSVAPVLAARLARIPVVLLEQNARPGRATRSLARFADVVAESYAGAVARGPVGRLRNVEVALTGNPVRREVLRTRATREAFGLDLDPTLPVLGVLGGSLGAVGLNLKFLDALPQLLRATGRRFQILHAAGTRERAEDLRDLFALHDVTSCTRAFFDDMAAFYGTADVLLSRAGGTTVAEISAIGRPAVFVPYPHHADRHQSANARPLADAGAARIVEEADLCPDTLTEALAPLLASEAQRAAWAARARRAGRPNAAEKVADIVLRMARRRPARGRAHRRRVRDSGRADRHRGGHPVIRTPGLFDKPRAVHLVGVGGVGVSALAQALKHGGHRVTGSDARDGVRVRRLRAIGLDIAVGHDAGNVPNDAEVIVATAAVGPTNPELDAARRRGVHVVKYAHALGELMGRHHGIAVAGTHGKTTTTGLLATMLVHGGLDPTMILGGDAAPLGGNFRPGDGRYFVAEACEFDRSFLELEPTTAIVTNIDGDHFDTYRDLDEIEAAFLDFARLLPEHGYLATLNEHERVFRRDGVRCKVETVGLRDNADWVATDWRRADGVTHFRVKHGGEYRGTFRLRLPGLHNLCNSLGVIAVAAHLGLDFETAVAPALLEYGGVERRMSLRYEGHGVLVLDDYAHHPQELAAVLTALRDENPGRRIVAVFQPHQASRTRRHLREFAESLKRADRVFVPDIYLARDSEAARRSVHALDLVRTAANRGVDVTYCERLDDVAGELLDEIRVGDLVVTMGAGSVGEVSRDLAERLRAYDSQSISP